VGVNCQVTAGLTALQRRRMLSAAMLLRQRRHAHAHHAHPLRPCLSIGEDKRVHMWEVGSWKPFAKAQPLQKATCHSIGWAPWGGTGLGAHPSLLLATGGRAVGGWDETWPAPHYAAMHAAMYLPFK
jgi:hypothetical protein